MILLHIIVYNLDFKFSIFILCAVVLLELGWHRSAWSLRTLGVYLRNSRSRNRHTVYYQDVKPIFRYTGFECRKTRNPNRNWIRKRKKINNDDNIAVFKSKTKIAKKQCKKQCWYSIPKSKLKKTFWDLSPEYYYYLFVFCTRHWTYYNGLLNLVYRSSNYD